LIWQLILRNLVRNRKSNLIVLLLIGIITFVFFIGSSIIGRTMQSMRDTYIDSITGDVLVEKAGDVSMNVFGANVAVIDEYFTIPVLSGHDALAAFIASEPRVAGVTSQVSSKALLDVENYRSPVMIAGVDAKTYFPLFPGIILKEGRFLQDGEFGAMITTGKARAIGEVTGTRPGPGDFLLLTAGGGIGFKIRSVPIVGIFEYKNTGQFMNEIVITDPQTARVLSSIQVAVAGGELDIDAASMDIISTDLDDLFNYSPSGAADGGRVSVAPNAEDSLSPDSVSSFLSDARKNASHEPVAGGDWNFIILRLHKGLFSSDDSFIASLNKKLAPFEAVAVNWQTAAGESATMLILIQMLFRSGIILVCIVCIITIVNILLISVFKRKREIGTLRAIGAADSYIRKLILGENVALACVSGFAGVIAGVVFLHLVNSSHITLSNRLIASLLGGETVHIELLPSSAVTSIVLAVLLGLAASLYPVETAVRIRPAEALRDSEV
jgi:ABC-type lipoprotein release transport system permease subunit